MEILMWFSEKSKNSESFVLSGQEPKALVLRGDVAFFINTKKSILFEQQQKMLYGLASFLKIYIYIWCILITVKKGNKHFDLQIVLVKYLFG